MITIFNRKEIATTYDIEKQNNIRKMLEDKEINYYCKVINRNSPSPFVSERSRTGTLGQNMEYNYEYIFYVKRLDYEKAKNIIT